MARAPRPSNPWLELLHLAWALPLIAVPFAGFFLLLQGAPWRTFSAFWIVAMIFGAPIALANWASGQFLVPVLGRRFPEGLQGTWWTAGLHVVASLIGALVAIGVLGLTLVPDFLINGRAFFIALTFSTIFTVLFLGASMAIQFYRQALSHAGSERELLLARRIQRSFLLSEFPARARLEVHAVNVSSKEVSGDTYDVVPVADDGLLLAIADVSGKGVPAALLSSMLQASLRTQAAMGASPAKMMTIINALACQRAVTGQFATAFLATVDEPTLTLRYTNAGHNFPVLLRADGTRELLETGGLVVGMMEGLPYEEGVVALGTGDRLVFYTDGVSEAANAAGEMFGEDRLYALLAALPGSLPAEVIVNRVLEGVRDFLGEAEAGDDITVMALRVLPASTTGAPR